MSYDIDLYDRQFLRRAIEQQLGDWTGADPLPSRTTDAAVAWLLARGYVTESEHTRLGHSFVHSNASWGVQAGVFRNCIAFTVPYWDDAAAAITAVKTDAIELAEFTHLAVHDPQTGRGED